MRDRGFAYEAPDRPASLYAGAATVTPEEIHTRHADVECQLQTRFVLTTSGSLAEAVDAWLEQNAETVAECLGLKDDHLRNLASIRQSLGMA